MINECSRRDTNVQDRGADGLPSCRLIRRERFKHGPAETPSSDALFQRDKQRCGTPQTTVEVIRSDLDARDLYRNALQTALEDARAEYLYQTKNSKKRRVGEIEKSEGEDEMDLSELISILKEAKLAIDKWFSFVPDQDVKMALEVVTRESKTNQ